MQLIAGAHGRQDGDPLLPGVGDQCQLGADGVDGVDDIIRLHRTGRKDLLEIFREYKGAACENGAVRVYICDLFFHHLCFFLSHSAQKSNALAVDVGWGDGVGIDKEQGSHAGPGQGFRTVGADAAQAEYGHGRGGQPCKALVSQKLGRPYKGFFHKIYLHSGLLQIANRAWCDAVRHHECIINFFMTQFPTSLFTEKRV